MSEEHKVGSLRERIKEGQALFDKELQRELAKGESWHSVSKTNFSNETAEIQDRSGVNFIGKNLQNGKFAKENLQGANFSVANLTGVDFSGANLRDVDFSGANLTDADLTGADLSGAVLSGAVLHRTNFTKAKLNGVKFIDADLEDAILLDIDIDVIGIEELQELIEYLAKYYPHKLNLTKINLTLLNLAAIDLKGVNLRGVDFTGVDFTGVNIAELDLSECIITPEQIAQALGRVPSKEELARILAPKKKQKAGAYNSLDFTDLFFNNKEFGVFNFQNDKGVSIESLLKMGKKVFGSGKKPETKDEKTLSDIKNEQEAKAKSHNDELRKIIEERKQKELESRKAMRDNVEQKEHQIQEKRHNIYPVRDQNRGR
ncbi:MAG: pentapeptide repeat-containing protein [Alphaproteobacteria bacterium]|nr:pentapeptide repeat-containing protein [Alphaproteobacteria bacterium]